MRDHYVTYSTSLESRWLCWCAASEDHDADGFVPLPKDDSGPYEIA